MKKSKGSLILVAGIILALVVPMAPALTYAQEGEDSLTNVVLEGLVDGFTGEAGSQLYGWMLGGGQSAGPDEISNELANIESTLTQIDTELAAINSELEKIACELDSMDLINTAATDLNTQWTQYELFLSNMKDGSTPSVSSLQTWANLVLNGGPTTQPALQSLQQLAEAGTPQAGNPGAIPSCVKSAGLGNLYKGGMIDDRPYYKAKVLPIQQWFLTYSTRAMVMITEAYHFQAACPKNNPQTCTQVTSSTKLISTVCPAGTTNTDCVSPPTLYSLPGNGFFASVKSEFMAGGAPYSTKDYVLLIGTQTVLATSIESYEKAAGNPHGCSFPLDSDPACGITVGTFGYQPQNISYGPYHYGKEGGGTWSWAIAPAFVPLLQNTGWNGSSGGQLASDALCSMDLSGSDTSPPCKQVNNGTSGNGGQGLFVGKKIIMFPESASCSSDACAGTGFPWNDFICFMDGNMPAQNWSSSIAENIIGDNFKFNMPICDQSTGLTILGVLDVAQCGPTGTTKQFGWFTRVELQSVGQFGSNVDWYNANYNGGGTDCAVPDASPQWQVSHNTQGQYHWPAFGVNLLACNQSGLQTNPAGPLTMCGPDFDIWFEEQVPPNTSAPLGETRDAQARLLESPSIGTVKVKGEYQRENPPNLRHVTALKVDQGLFDGKVGGKGELVRDDDGHPLTGLELHPIRGAVQSKLGIFRTPYGQEPNVRVTIKIDKAPPGGQSTIYMEMEVKGATVDTPATCEVNQGKRVTNLGTKITLVNAEETHLPLNDTWECRLRENQLVLLEAPSARSSCKATLGGCSATSP